MRISLFAITAVAVLAACAGNRTALVPAAPNGVNGQLRHSWMDAGVNDRDLLYVTNGSGLVNVYRYWQHKLVGVLTNFSQPMGECVDNTGDVYITDYKADGIAEYAHGATKPLRVIKDSYKPFGCAIDPKTGNLAVANYGEGYDSGPRNDSGGNGNVAIYLHAKGKPSYYGANQHFTACGYDKYGDLLAASVENYSSSYYYSGDFDYLPARSKDFTQITLPGPRSSWNWGQILAIGWDGQYWVVDDSAVYRYSINIRAQYFDTISLSNAGDLGPVSIYRKTPKSPATQIVGTSGYTGYSSTDVTYWKYPAGGTPLYQISSKDLVKPYGVAISLKR